MSERRHACLGHASQRGFSLIDLLIVVMIVGILATMLQPQFHSAMVEMKLNGAAGEVVAALQYARSLAVTHQKPFLVKVYSATARNQLVVKDTFYATDPNLHLDAVPPVYSHGRVFNPHDKKPYIIDFDDIDSDLADVISPRREFEGVKIISVPGGGTDGTIRFYPDGHSSETDSAVVLSLGNEQRTITVDGLMGRITVN